LGLEFGQEHDAAAAWGFVGDAPTSSAISSNSSLLEGVECRRRRRGPASERPGQMRINQIDQSNTNNFFYQTRSGRLITNNNYQRMGRRRLHMNERICVAARSSRTRPSCRAPPLCCHGRPRRPPGPPVAPSCPVLLVVVGTATGASARMAGEHQACMLCAS
jgi:hypothetical protein